MQQMPLVAYCGVKSNFKKQNSCRKIKYCVGLKLKKSSKGLVNITIVHCESNSYQKTDP